MNEFSFSPTGQKFQLPGPEDYLNPKPRIIVGGPPSDAECHVCGRHLSELKPFGGPGDPLEDDFTGELLVETCRSNLPYDEEAEKALEEIPDTKEGETKGVNWLPWLIAKYGEEKAEYLFIYASAQGFGWFWECRDWIVLNEAQYFEETERRYRDVSIE